MEEKDILAILGRNTLRTMKVVEAEARRLQAASLETV
jgi:hypothetical protein